MAVHYHDYLQLDKVLNAQATESGKQQIDAHDEMLFIVIHQAYELWFHQLHYELDSVIAIMKRPSLNDNSPELQTVVHRVNRMVTILRVLVHQIDIMETMTPMDFLDFRDLLRPASGFQSWQFKELEARLGLKFDQRHGKEYYTAQLRQEHIDRIRKAEQDQSLLQLVNSWLERVPFFEGGKAPADWAFWNEYRTIYQSSLADVEQANLEMFDHLFFGKPLSGGLAAENTTVVSSGGGCPMGHGAASSTTSVSGGNQLSVAGARSALFIMLYRGYPLLQLPFQLINGLLEIDEQLSSWRYRHMNMVHRIIGTRIGTGGSTGKDYLRAAADKHYIFREFAQLNSFLIERHRLPSLPAAVEKQLGFVTGSSL